MGLSLETSVPVLTVFLQGLLSFFSPCVLPLVPLYVSYLAGGARDVDSDGNIRYPRGRVLVNTLFFVVGISFTFFLLGFGFTALGSFFRSNQTWFARISGIIMILFGLYQFGVFGRSGALEREHRLPFRLDRWAMNPLVALVLGFTFSFAWTPCVGPALASVLLMAASASTKALAFGLIGVYTLGFVLPFLAVGLFTTSLLEFFKTHGNVVKYTVKVGGILMIFMGLLMFTGRMNAVTGYLSRFQTQSSVQGSKEPGEGGDKTPAMTAGTEPESADSESGAETEATEAETGKTDTADAANPAEAGNTSAASDADKANAPEETAGDGEEGADQAEAGAQEVLPAIDFTLKDQYGNTHSLSDYKGKTIFLNFWATWCPPCRAEMPDIQKIYETYDTEGDDALIVLGVAGPGYGNEKSEEGIKEFLDENGYTYPVLMDTTGELFSAYGIYSYPTTFMIDRDGNVFGYASGQLNEDMMKNIIEQTMEGKRR